MSAITTVPGVAVIFFHREIFSTSRDFYRLYYPLCVSRRIDTWQIVYYRIRIPVPKYQLIKVRLSCLLILRQATQYSWPLYTFFSPADPVTFWASTFPLILFQSLVFWAAVPVAWLLLTLLLFLVYFCYRCCQRDVEKKKKVPCLRWGMVVFAIFTW